MRILSQAAALLCLIFFAIGANATGISKKQVQLFYDKIIQASEKRDIKFIQNCIADDAVIELTLHKKNGKTKTNTFNKRKYIHTLNNQWNMMQSDYSEIMQTNIALNEDKTKAIVKVKSKVKQIIAASVIRGSNDDVIEIEKVDGELKVTKSVGDFYLD